MSAARATFSQNRVLGKGSTQALSLFVETAFDQSGQGLDGFLGPGHVSTVVGNRPYRFVTEQYRKPLVTTGFEPLDVLQAIDMLLAQIREGRCEIENQYARVVRDEGNPRALAVLAEVFELRPHFEWRGLGFISQSALKLRPEFAAFDVEEHYALPGVRVVKPLRF